MAALGKNEDEHVLEANWDITKCFENIDRDTLARIGKELGYPTSVLRLSLASYSWRRRLRGDLRILTDDIYASRGIVAGSAFAIF